MEKNQSKKFDLEAFRKDLASLVIHLEHRSWTFQANNYRDFLILQEEEAYLFSWANKLGIQGVTAYVDAQRAAMDSVVDAEVREAIQQNDKGHRARIEYLRGEVEAVKEKYMTAVDRYKEVLDQHDWFYDYSDSASVSRAGRESEKKLIQQAKDGGAELQNALLQKWADTYKSTTTWTSLEAKLRY